MTEISRRDFLKTAGTGGAAVALGALPLVKDVVDSSGQLSFKATAGIPERPLPSYATHIVEGQVDLVRGTGLVTSRVIAGHPGDSGLVGLPGLSRVIKITAAETHGRQIQLTGVVEDRSQLRKGESAEVEITIDRAQKRVLAPFVGRKLDHTLAT